MARKTFLAMLAAGAAFIAIGIAASIYANTAVAVPLDGTVKPGLADELSPDMNVGNTASMQVKGSTFDVEVREPDGVVVVSQKGLSNFTYELTATKAGEHRITIQNTGSQNVQITGTAQTKSSPLELSGSLMLVVTGIIVVGLGLRFRDR
ncbi:hypothetical protein [Nitrososphaera viennensis]|uniref:Emp24/gp25L/p24 family protein n=2 Tax=Nitrososphaera viennensis TaxID=1034015 RepID=A0A060HMA0_9ARCH|nr:hypothetical protein [Nitrososphaera viennensis]AIC16603.1 hypothetical protein NVIE_023440 [Nitrososphaera viennensis EN76]UVS68530.1 hypothetical protein NWT39_11535 [Nitrososphaera viennensis]